MTDEEDDKKIRDRVLKTMLDTPPQTHKKQKKTDFDFDELVKDLPKAPRVKDED